MNQQTALVLGATGLIGNSVLHYLLNDDAYGKVIVLSRSPLHYAHPKLQVHVVDFRDPASYNDKIEPGDVIFCCVGTTMKKVKGDKKLYRHIDFEIPVEVARAGVEKGYAKYILVSAVGADEKAGNFYLKLKGETETAIRQCGFTAVHIMRPSLLLGKRMENRVGEGIAQVIMPALSFLLPGKWSRYKPVQGSFVAKAMVKLASGNERGVKIYYFEDIQQLVKS